MRVLIADDSPVVRERLRTMLSEIDGIQIAGEAQDVIEAEDRVERLKPDVLILDIRLPGGNGIEVLKRIKEKKSACAVIMLTNYPYPQYRQASMAAGADFFFDKSTEFERVTDVLRELMRERKVQ
jgi:DNA-binding NarL/FixJ family response regulator